MTSSSKSASVRYPGQCIHAVVGKSKGKKFVVRCELRYSIKNKDLIQCRYYESEEGLGGQESDSL
jgi:hypothetical protein